MDLSIFLGLFCLVIGLIIIGLIMHREHEKIIKEFEANYITYKRETKEGNTNA